MRELRGRTSKTAQDIAVELGVAVSTVGGWEQGRYMPRMTPLQLHRLCKAYDCTFEELVEIEIQRERRNAIV